MDIQSSCIHAPPHQCAANISTGCQARGKRRAAFRYSRRHAIRRPQAVHDAGARLRRRHRHPVHGHPPRLRPVAAAHHAGAGLDARDLRLRHRHPEPGLGRASASSPACWPTASAPSACWSAAPCSTRWAWPAWRCRPTPLRVRADGRRADRRGAGRHHLRGDLRRDRPPDRPGQALLGHGRGGGGRLVRPVPDGAGGGLADRRPRLAAGAAGAGAVRAADRAAGLRPARAGLRRRRAPPRREQTIAAGAARGLQVPELPAADGRLLRLRLPGGVHRRAHAQLPARTRACRRRWPATRWR